MAEKAAGHAGRFNLVQHILYLVFIFGVHIADVYRMNLFGKVFYHRFVNLGVVLRGVAQQYKPLLGKAFNNPDNTGELRLVVVLSGLQQLVKLL